MIMPGSMIFGPDIPRYAKIDEDFVLFTTPQELKDLSFGFDIKPYVGGWENDLQPFAVEYLVEVARETLLGANNGTYLGIPVENAECFIVMCVEINGKLCKLQSGELEHFTRFNLPVSHQVKTFQRLISEGQITLADLNTADIDNMVYKQLMVNDVSGVKLFNRAIWNFAKIIAKNYKSKKWRHWYDPYKDSKKLKGWLELAKKKESDL